MLDPRAEKLAKLVVDYSLEINESDRLLVRGEISFKEFAEKIGEEARKKGAEVVFDYIDPKKKRELIEKCDEAELEKERDRLCVLAESVTAMVNIDAESDPRYLEGVAPEKIARHATVVSSPFLDRIAGDGKKFKGIKWNMVAFPCESGAEKAGMSLSDYEKFVYESMIGVDWKSVGESMRKWKGLLDNAKDVRILVQKETDLRFSLGGRGGCICDGKFNMPDGEFYYSPVEDSVEGHVFFPYTYFRAGNVVKGVKLVFKKGKVVEFSAEENEDFLKKMLELNGAKRLGEFGVGCNYSIENYTHNPLFDEKIGGTVHFAIGSAYKNPLENGGGKNESDIHWDLVCELRKVGNRPGGEIYVDNVLVQKDGIFVK